MPSALSAPREDLDPRERGLDLLEHDPMLFQTMVEVSRLARQFSGRVATFRVNTHKELRYLLDVIAPTLEIQGVRVSARTNDEDLKRELRSLGMQQVIGNRPSFLVEGNPTSRIRSNQRDTQIHVAQSAASLKEHFDELPQRRLADDEVMQVREIPVSRLNVRSLERWLTEGKRASILIDDIETVTEGMWMELRRLKHTYKDSLVLNAKQRKGEDVKAIWDRIGAQMHAQGNGHAVHVSENRRPNWMQRAGRRIGSIFRSAWAALAA